MPLNFPNSPIDGQVYTYNNLTWTWNAAFSSWLSATPQSGATGATGATGLTGSTGFQGATGLKGNASVTADSSPPVTVANGDLWWDTELGELRIYYDDGNSTQWVSALANSGPQGATGFQGSTGLSVTGATGLTGATGPITAAIVAVFDGAGPPLSTGVKTDISIPFSGTITAWTLLADQVGNLVVDIWKDTYANYPPTVADTITAGLSPTLVSSSKNTSSTLTGWTTSFSEGDIFRYNISSTANINRATLTLKVTKTS